MKKRIKLEEALELIKKEIATCNGHYYKQAQEQHAYNIMCRVRLINDLFNTRYTVVRNTDNNIELLEN